MLSSCIRFVEHIYAIELASSTTLRLVSCDSQRWMRREA